MNKKLLGAFFTATLFGVLLGLPFVAHGQEYYNDSQRATAAVYGVTLLHDSEFESTPAVSSSSVNSSSSVKLPSLSFPWLRGFRDSGDSGDSVDDETYMKALSELHGYAADLFKSPTSNSVWLESICKIQRGGPTLEAVLKELNKQKNLGDYTGLVYLKEDLKAASDREFTIAQIAVFFIYYLTATRMRTIKWRCCALSTSLSKERSGTPSRRRTPIICLNW